jgi:hypothetical protein
MRSGCGWEDFSECRNFRKSSLALSRRVEGSDLLSTSEEELLDIAVQYAPTSRSVSSIITVVTSQVIFRLQQFPNGV